LNEPLATPSAKLWSQELLKAASAEENGKRMKIAEN